MMLIMLGTSNSACTLYLEIYDKESISNSDMIMSFVLHISLTKPSKSQILKYLDLYFGENEKKSQSGYSTPLKYVARY